MIRLLVLAAIVGLVALIGGRWAIGGRVAALEAAHGEPLVFDGLRRTGRPNQVLLADPGDTAETDLDGPAPRFAAPPEALASALDAFLGEEPRVKELARSEDGWRRTVLQRSALLGFPDLISLEIRPAEGGGSRLLLYSRSVMGYSDLGVNRARVDRWLGALRARLPPQEGDSGTNDPPDQR